MNISGTQVLRDSQGRAVPQYYDYAENKFKPISIEDVSHVNVLQTIAQYGRRSSEYVVYPNQYLGADGIWYVYDPLTFRAEHDDEIDLALVVRSVNGILPDENGNVNLICEHDGFVKSVDGALPDEDGNVAIQFPIIDLSDYALNSQLDAYATLLDLDSYALSEDLSLYATLDDLEDFATTAQLSNYALKSDIPEAQDISHLATRGELAQLELDLGEYLEDFATLDDIVDLVERDELPEFNDFATKAEVYQELNNYVNHAEAQAFARLVELEDYALKTEIPKVPKFYSAIATVAESGLWSIDYSSAGFTKVLSVTPTPIAQSETAAHMPTHSNLTSITLTGASGIAYKASSAGLLAAMQQVRAEAGTQVQVLVIGE